MYEGKIWERGEKGKEKGIWVLDRVLQTDNKLGPLIPKRNFGEHSYMTDSMCLYYLVK